MTPRDHISTAFVYESSDRSHDWTNPSISGAANAGVPVKVRSAVSPSVALLLIPKSAILTHQSGPLQTINRFYLGHSLLVYVGIVNKSCSYTDTWLQIPMREFDLMHEM
jgi:hypothetical protein